MVYYLYLNIFSFVSLWLLLLVLSLSLLNNYKSWLKSNDNWFELGLFLEVSFPLYYLRPKKRGFLLCFVFDFLFFFSFFFSVFLGLFFHFYRCCCCCYYCYFDESRDISMTSTTILSCIRGYLALYSLILSLSWWTTNTTTTTTKQKKPIKKVYKLKSHESDPIHLFGG